MNLPIKALTVFSLINIISFSLPCFADKILIIGDSLTCGPFGKNLLKNLSQEKNSVTLYCAVSSTPHNWLMGQTPAGQKCQTMTTKKQSLQPCNGNGELINLE